VLKFVFHDFNAGFFGWSCGVDLYDSGLFRGGFFDGLSIHCLFVFRGHSIFRGMSFSVEFLGLRFLDGNGSNDRTNGHGAARRRDSARNCGVPGNVWGIGISHVDRENCYRPTSEKQPKLWPANRDDRLIKALREA
jgi:hypothetical protein